jgi:hypothetical protein
MDKTDNIKLKDKSYDDLNENLLITHAKRELKTRGQQLADSTATFDGNIKLLNAPSNEPKMEINIPSTSNIISTSNMNSYSYVRSVVHEIEPEPIIKNNNTDIIIKPEKPKSLLEQLAKIKSNMKLLDETLSKNIIVEESNFQGPSKAHLDWLDEKERFLKNKSIKKQEYTKLLSDLNNYDAQEKEMLKPILPTLKEVEKVYESAYENYKSLSVDIFGINLLANLLH